jgi:hypothetical protein
MSAFVVERELKGLSVDQPGVAQKAEGAGSQWQRRAKSKWGTTAVWIHGDGRFAVLQPCSEQLTVTLCGSLGDAARAKKETCCSRCSKSRHMITDLGDRATDAQGLAGYREDGGES